MDAATPFQPLWAPWLSQAENQAREALGPSHPALALWPGMAQHLEARCLALGGRVLLKAFRRHQAQLEPTAWLLGPPTEGEGHFHSFVEAWEAGEGAACLKAHPFLAEGLALLSQQATEAFVAWAEALAEDAPALSAQGLAPQPFSWPQSVEWGASDPHSGGRSVALMRWGDGRRLVHKPREGGLELAWQGLLAWVAERDPRWALPTVPMLARPGRLWMAHVAHEGCPDEAGVGRFYGRVGALMALLHLVYGNDCHHENLMAASEWPVVVDAESFLLPDFRFHPEARPQHPAWATVHQLSHGVLLSGLLPLQGEGSEGGLALRCEGLLLPPEADQGLTWGWVAANTNRMRLAQGPAPTRSLSNLPHLGGLPQGPEGHVPALVEGFAGRWRWLVAQREALLAPEGPLQGFAGCQGRFVPRPSYVYAQLLRRLSHPEALASASLREAELAKLGQAFAALPAEAQGATQALLQAEQRALRRWDLPWFGVRTDGDALLAEGEALPGHLAIAGLPRAVARLKGMDEVGLDHELGLIRAALGAPGPPPRTQGPRPSAPPLAHRCEALAHQLKARAVWGADGGACWAYPKRGLGVRQHGAQSPGLYHGRLGTAIALAAWGRLEGDAEARKLAGAAALAAQRDGVAAGAWGLGDGLGGWLYGLGLVGAMLGRTELLEAAWRAAEAPLEEAIAQDRGLDVVSGCAGLALGLASLPQLGPQGQANLAACVQRLLATQLPSGAWPDEAQAPQGLLGFAHGAAGMAWALAKAAEGLPPALAQAARAAALKAWALESQQQLPSGQGWPDWREGAAPAGGPFVQAWCHGAVGVGLARAGALALAPWPQAQGAAVGWRQDLAAALQASRQAPPTGGDALCCGTAGRVALLQSAGLLDEAQSLAEALSWEAGPEGWPHVSPGGAFCPSLFQGAAGVLYTQLRLAHPHSLPEILLLAPWTARSAGLP